MSQIFLSYSRRDRDAARRLVQVIEEDGHQVRRDDDIKGGQLWRAEIVKAIKTADMFVVVLSSSSIASDEVRTELDIAADEKKPIMPVFIEQVAIPDEMRYALTGRNWIDASEDVAAGHRAVKEAVRSRPPQARTSERFEIANKTRSQGFSSSRATEEAAGDRTSKRLAAQRAYLETLTRANANAENLLGIYDRLIEKMKAVVDSPSLSAILPGRWKVWIQDPEWPLGMELPFYEYTIVESGRYSCSYGEVLTKTLEGTWSVDKNSVRFEPDLVSFSFGEPSSHMTFIFDEIDPKQLRGTFVRSRPLIPGLAPKPEELPTWWQRI